MSAYQICCPIAKLERLLVPTEGSKFRGRTGMEKLLMGSVTERVIGHAGCAVLVVKK